MPLNARQINTAKPKEKEYKLTDGGGLYLLVKPNGARYWRLKYRFLGDKKLLEIYLCLAHIKVVNNKMIYLKIKCLI